jgi:hypothetical protein
LESIVSCGWKGSESERDSSPIKTIYINADREVPVEGFCNNSDCRNGEEIVHIRRGRKVGGGERRRNKGPSKTKIGK